MRLAVVTTSLFAFGDAIGNGQIALYGAFGSIAILIFAPFGGPPASRLRAYLVLAVTGLVMVTLGTLASHDAWVAGLSMTVIAFVILMAGILNGYVAAGANAALLAFVISVMIPVPASQIPDRLAGWALAALVAISAAMLVWPSRGRDQVRADLATALRALADSVAELVKGDPDRVAAADDAARGAIDKLRRTFTSVPYRPTGATGPTAALSRLVGDLSWLRPLVHTLPGTLETRQDFGPEAERLETAAIDALRSSASTLERGPDRPDVEGLDHAREETAAAFSKTVTEAIEKGDDEALAAQLEEAFRLRTLSYGTWQIGIDALLAAGHPAPDPDQPTVEDEVQGKGPMGRTVGAARQLLAGHLSTDSVWFRNSLRGAVGLGASRPRRPASRAPALVLGRAGNALGAALERARDRFDDPARARRDRGRDPRRRRHRRPDRVRGGPALGGPSVRLRACRLRAAGDLLRGRPGAFTMVILILFDLI